MKSAPLSLKVFGIYMILVPGLGLMAFPAFILDLFQLSQGPELWIPRMLGLLAFIIGIFDYTIGARQISILYRHTVILRSFAALFMTILFLTGQVGVAILLFAAVDAAGAAWTMVGMQKGE